MQLVKKSTWRFLPTACGIIMGLVLIVVDPLLSHAPWWTYPEADLWGVLLFPLLPWLGCAGVMAWLGFVLSTRLGIVLVSLVSISLGVIPSAFWTLLLYDVFPESGSLALSMNMALVAGAIAIPLAVVVLIRATLAKRPHVAPE